MTFEGFRVSPPLYCVLLLVGCVLIRILFFLRIHALVQVTHQARSMALRLAVSAPLCEGNDCRCVWKPLVGTRRSKQETNKHYGSVSLYSE